MPEREASRLRFTFEQIGPGLLRKPGPETLYVAGYGEVMFETKPMWDLIAASFRLIATAGSLWDTWLRRKKPN